MKQTVIPFPYRRAEVPYRGNLLERQEKNPRRENPQANRLKQEINIKNFQINKTAV
jgi:hypothetical protein